MLNEGKLVGIIETALDYAKGKAQGAEVTVVSTDQASSRFALNAMTQNQCRSVTDVSLRLLKNGRQVRLSTNDLSPAAVRQLVDDALLAASYLQPDQEPMALPGKGRKKILPVHRFDEATAGMTAAARADAIKRIVAVAKECKLSCAGELATGTVARAVGNSRGMHVYHCQTESHCSITMSDKGATGWSKSQQISFEDLNVEGLALKAAGTAISNVNPVEIAPGKYTVILEPSAVLDLLCWLWYDFTGTSYQDKLSCFLNKLGTRVFGENITIRDDVYHPLQSGAPFDGEGQLRQAVDLVKDGVVQSLVYGRRSAHRAGVEPTGHGLPEPCAEGEFPVNIIVVGGETLLDDMIAATEYGIVLRRVWYVREVDQTSKIVTGMTRDGTFLVRDGVLTKAVKNLRFNQSLIELLNNVVDLGPSERTAGEEGEPNVMPAMKVEQFNFAATTEF
jgi:PmbA protein